MAALLGKGRTGGHTATLLPDGQVLVVGGFDHRSSRLASAEVWDPEGQTFGAAGRMAQVRVGHTATLLPDGRVLVVGGSHRRDNRKVDSAVAWDRESASFAPAGALATGRAGHTATLLPDGRVLVVGGVDAGNVTLADAKVWDPVTQSFSPAGDLAEARLDHTATLLPDGRVVVIAGNGGGLGISGLPSAEVWESAIEAFTPAGSLAEGRWSHTATLLADGRVLVVGGNLDGDTLASAETWDPTADAPALPEPAIPAVGPTE